jgi:uncharacterized membrane protein
MTATKRALLWLMAAAYMFAGFNHVMNPAFYVAIIPPGLPEPEWLNLISGLAEIVLGVYLLEPRTRVFAAWGTIALLIAVFPANLYVAMENIGLPGGTPGTGAGALNWVRIPFQALFILWAWWYTRPEEDFPAPAAKRWAQERSDVRPA